MIKHHPKFELIQAFVHGDLPASLSAGIAIHASMCDSCQSKITQLTEQIAEASFEHDIKHGIEDGTEQHMAMQNRVENQLTIEEVCNFDVDDMIANITQSDDVDLIKPALGHTVEFKNKTYLLPRALNSIKFGKTAQIGKLARTRLILEEDEIHTSLLHIEPGGGVPEHTHKGFELTLLLDGSFSDESGEYVKGDFIMLDSSAQHHPVSAQGCLCYTVVNASLHFTKGINKLLNPIGSFIY